MKTTIDLPDDLLIQAKTRAVRLRTTLKELVIAGLRRELASESEPAKRAITWVTVAGGLPKGVDAADRETLAELYRESR
jgi:hypothetical protein